MELKEEHLENSTQSEYQRRLPYPGFQESHLEELDPWMTTQEAATFSGYDIQHVRRLAREGKIGAIKRGRDWWIDTEMFLAFLEGVFDSDDGREGPRGEPDPGALRRPLRQLPAQE
jgi:excisionase family DNA binding protein